MTADYRLLTHNFRIDFIDYSAEDSADQPMSFVAAVAFFQREKLLVISHQSLVDLLQKSENTLKPSASIGVASARYLRLLYDSKIFAILSIVERIADCPSLMTADC
ncbi:MAG: hypothetical protein ABI262_10245 [Microcoleus sp.]|jgi:hypothetical protein